MEILAEVIGMMGVVLLLAAYFLIQTHKLEAEGYMYSVLNLLGSLMILYSVFYAWNLAAFVIEIAWALISLYGIWRRYTSMQRAL